MTESRFLPALKERVILGDGAYGTEFLRRGCLPGRPLDELNLTRPHVVLALHKDYRDAGSELTKTNTFLSNGFRLKPHGLGDKVRDINREGVQLAKEAARGGLVAGTVGPLTECPRAERMACYQEQIGALVDAGCDVLVLETFTEVSDLLTALEVGKKSGLPVVGQLTPKMERGFDRMIPRGPGWGLAAVGTNCLDPDQTRFFIERTAKNADLPLTAFPSAGLPGQTLPPKEFARALKGLVDLGVRLVGGCCGTGPDHIRQAADLLGKGR